MIKVIVRPAQAGQFTATAAGLKITSRTPLFSMARKLIESGLADHGTELQMMWFGADTAAMIGKAGALAKLTVEEGERLPTIRRWKAHSFAAVSSGNRFSGEAATPIAGKGSRALLHGSARYEPAFL
jgi:hypothetical protein